MSKYRNIFFKINWTYRWLFFLCFIASIITLGYILSSSTFFILSTLDSSGVYNKENSWGSYEDMNFDGKDDIVESKYLISALNRTVFFENKPMLSVASCFGDYNDDGLKEIYFLTTNLDSVFLTNWNINESKVKNIFLEKINIKFSVDFLDFINANNDGCSEIYLYGRPDNSAGCWFMFRYDIKNDSLAVDKDFGTEIISGFIKDVKGEVGIVVNLNSFNSQLLEKEAACREYCAMFFILDKYFKKNHELVCFDIRRNGKDRVCVVGDSRDLKDNGMGMSQISIYDYCGKKLDSKIINKDLLLHHKGYIKVGRVNNYEVFLSCHYGGVLRYDSRLSYGGIRFSDSLDKAISGFAKDIDGNGKKEILFYDFKFQKLVATNENMSLPIEISLIELYSPISYCKAKYDVCKDICGREVCGGGIEYRKENVILHCGNFTYFLDYVKDDFFGVKYVYVLLVFCSVFLMTWFIRCFIANNIEKKSSLENTIARLKCQNINNQMSPHFTLNVINSIASLIYKEDRDTAYDYFCKLAKLVRSSLVDANRLERSLVEEIEFVEGYLELQKFRFKTKFDYSIKIEDSSVYSYKIMPFLIQTFVENAIQHGLKDVRQGGKIIIKVNVVHEGINIVIEDNGKGRKAVAFNNINSTGKGILLVNEYIEILNKKDNRNMSIIIHDLEEDNIALGTRVVIFIDKI